MLRFQRQQLPQEQRVVCLWSNKPFACKSCVFKLLHLTRRKTASRKPHCQTLDLTKKLNLTLPLQIPHPCQEKVKFPTLGNAFHVKFPTPRAKVMDRHPGFAWEGEGKMLIGTLHKLSTITYQTFNLFKIVFPVWTNGSLSLNDIKHPIC